MLSLTLISGLLLASTSATATKANCQSGRYTFESGRMLALDGSPAPANIDVGRFDFTIDYGTAQVRPNPAGGIDLTLSKAADGSPASGVTISTTRKILHAKITAKMTVPRMDGMVTDFMTLSGDGDQIIYQFPGNSPESVGSNVYFKGIPEDDVHSRILPVGYGGTPATHEYSLNWESLKLEYRVDGTVLRTVNKFSPESLSPMTPAGQRWFPNSPSKVQFSVWDGGSSKDQGESAWAGGPINWGTKNSVTVTISYLDIQCYDESSKPVQEYPVCKENPKNHRVLPAVTFYCGKYPMMNDTVSGYQSVTCPTSAPDPATTTAAALPIFGYVSPVTTTRATLGYEVANPTTTAAALPVVYDPPTSTAAVAPAVATATVTVILKDQCQNEYSDPTFDTAPLVDLIATTTTTSKTTAASLAASGFPIKYALSTEETPAPTTIVYNGGMVNTVLAASLAVPILVLLFT